MKIDYIRSFRKLSGLLIAIILYYVIHEGAHLLYALMMGTFKQINFIEMGVQIEVYRDQMGDVQTAVFCLVGAAATLLTGWFLVLMTKRIVGSGSLVFRAAAFYVTLVFLLNDPFYLSVLYPYVGGGDMNGIKLLIPEQYARIFFGSILVIHLVLIAKYLYPAYKIAFQDTTKMPSDKNG